MDVWNASTISDSLEHATIWALWSTSLDAPIRLEKIKEKWEMPAITLLGILDQWKDIQGTTGEIG